MRAILSNLTKVPSHFLPVKINSLLWHLIRIKNGNKLLNDNGNLLDDMQLIEPLASSDAELAEVVGTGEKADMVWMGRGVILAMEAVEGTELGLRSYTLESPAGVPGYAVVYEAGKTVIQCVSSQ